MDSTGGETFKWVRAQHGDKSFLVPRGWTPWKYFSRLGPRGALSMSIGEGGAVTFHLENWCLVTCLDLALHLNHRADFDVSGLVAAFESAPAAAVADLLTFHSSGELETSCPEPERFATFFEAVFVAARIIASQAIAELKSAKGISVIH